MVMLITTQGPWEKGKGAGHEQGLSLSTEYLW